MSFGRGKVILLGEHGVVYGHPALALAIERGVTASAEPAAADRLDIEPWAVSVAPDEDAAEPLARAFHAVLAAAAPEPGRPALHVRARVEVPGGAGLGCSAALGVAVMGAVDDALGTVRTPEALGEDSLVWERVFHGNPSGVDSAMAARGGVAVFRRGSPLEPVRPARPLRLVIANSGEPSGTREMVESVARQHGRDPRRVNKVFEGIAALVQNARIAVEAGDHRNLGQLMDLNHALLNALMLSTARLEELCATARRAGASGAKLTGAGGGGCMIALVEPDLEARVLGELSALAAEVFVAEVRG